MSELIVIVALCGVGTFLLRFLPIWQARRRRGTTSPSGPLRAFLQGIGPAAITALLVVSLWSMIRTSPQPGHLLIVAAALASIFILNKWLDGIAAPTLGGALVYGTLMHFFS